MGPPDAPPYILHILTPLRTVSPFDVTQAVDAGYAVVEPYTSVALDDVGPLVHGAVRARPPEMVRRTALFISGYDAALAWAMLDAAGRAMPPPYQTAILLDPAGAFTAAAALVTRIEQLLSRHDSSLSGRMVQIYGAVGAVGGIVGLAAAMAGARVTLVSHRGIAAVSGKATDFKRRFGVDLLTANGPDDNIKNALLTDAEIIINCAASGTQVLNVGHLRHARRLLLAADINDDPPAGIAGISPDDDGGTLPALPAVMTLGARVVEHRRAQLLHRMLVALREAPEPLRFDLPEILAMARGGHASS